MQFAQLIGNQHIADIVRKQVDDDRLPHALLLHGEPGVPKLALARTIAQYIHCTDRHDGEPCGKCPACRQHQSFNHTDTFYSFPYLKKTEESVCDDFMNEWKEFITENPLVEDYQRWLSILRNENAQPQIMVKESAAIIRKMRMSTFTSKYKVLIMWLPEKMSEVCSNKLLKLIEEPYDDCKFLLVSDNPKALLPTILSRTQRLELRKPSVDTIADYLVAQYNIDRQDAVAMAAPADGNVNLAEQGLRQDSETREFHQMFVELMRLAYAAKLIQLRKWANDVTEFKREKARRFLEYGARQLRENFICNLHNPSLNYLTQEEQQFSTRFAPFINDRNIEQLVDEFNRAATDIAGNGNGRMVLFDLAINVAMLIRK